MVVIDNLSLNSTVLKTLMLITLEAIKGPIYFNLRDSHLLIAIIRITARRRTRSPNNRLKYVSRSLLIILLNMD